MRDFKELHYGDRREKHCQEDHRHDERFLQLPEGQGGEGRGRCPGHAYELGLEQGLRYESPRLDLKTLPPTQAGTVRHRCPLLAFVMGYEEGLRRYHAQKAAA